MGLTGQIMNKLSQEYEYLWPIAALVFRAAWLSLRFSPIMLNVSRVRCIAMRFIHTNRTNDICCTA